MSEVSRGEFIYSMPAIDFDNEEVWDRRSLESAVSAYADTITECMKAGFSVGQMGVYPLHHKDAISYACDPDNWSGYLIEVNPKTARRRNLSIDITKVDRRDYILLDDTKKTFNFSPQVHPRRLFQNFEREEIVALGTAFVNIVQSTHHREDEEMLHELTLNGQIPYPFESTVTIPPRKQIPEQEINSHYHADLIEEANRRLEQEGDQYDPQIRSLYLHKNVGGLDYYAEFHQTNLKKVEAINMECYQDNKKIDGFAFEIDEENKLIISEPPRMDIVWSPTALAELLIEGSKLSENDYSSKS
jgi:hypothetical protein